MLITNLRLTRVPKLFPYTFEDKGKLVAQSPLHLSGNALDATFLANSSNVIVSVDNVHEPGSTIVRRSLLASPQAILEVFSIYASAAGLVWEKTSNAMADAVNGRGTAELISSGDETESKQQWHAISNLLYCAGNLRKRGREEDEQEEGRCC